MSASVLRCASQPRARTLTDGFPSPWPLHNKQAAMRDTLPVSLMQWCVSMDQAESACACLPLCLQTPIHATTHGVCHCRTPVLVRDDGCHMYAPYRLETHWKRLDVSCDFSALLQKCGRHTPQEHWTNSTTCHWVPNAFSTPNASLGRCRCRCRQQHRGIPHPCVAFWPALPSQRPHSMLSTGTSQAITDTQMHAVEACELSRACINDTRSSHRCRDYICNQSGW